jgi:GNAT superfamily N-acetyltransferase
MREGLITVRLGGLADVEGIIAMQAAMALETERIALDPATLRRGVLAVVRDPALGSYYVAERSPGATSGMLLVTPEWSDWRAGFVLWIQSVYVNPDARRSGVFRALFEHVEALAKGRPDVMGIRLYVEAHNKRALETYKALGMSADRYNVCEKLSTEF